MGAPDWVERQLVRRGITDSRVLEAMVRVPREAFVPDGSRQTAYADVPVPLPHGQTISQPYMVALMCQALALAATARVLDVGTGSGYAAAVLAELAGEVHTIERIPELAESAGVVLEQTGYGRVHVHVGDGSRGLPEEAPFDAIAVAAAAGAVPPAFWAQLCEGGRLAIPLRTGGRGQRLCVLERGPRGPRLIATVPARFVPLVIDP